jgi:phosphonate transport system permease protein
VKRAGLFVLLVVLAWTAWDTGADPVRLVRGVPWIFDILRRMLPPDPSVLPAALLGALKTVEMALLGTAAAAVLALPLGFVSARNVAPPSLFYPARAVLNFFRSVDTLVYALIFVAAVGLGPFPGVLAVVAYTTTSLAKLYSEAVEGIERGPVDAITATGATRLQILRFGVLPQVLPMMLSNTLYMFEHNVRSASILGIVGAGGIGFLLADRLRAYELQEACLIIILVVLTVYAIDYLSTLLRERLIGDRARREPVDDDAAVGEDLQDHFYCRTFWRCTRPITEGRRSRSCCAVVRHAEHQERSRGDQQRQHPTEARVRHMTR